MYVWRSNDEVSNDDDERRRTQLVLHLYIGVAFAGRRFALRPDGTVRHTVHDQVMVLKHKQGESRRFFSKNGLLYYIFFHTHV